MRRPYALIAAVHHGQHQADKSHSVADRVMDAYDDGSPALVILDDVHLPKRPRLVQMFGSKLGDVALKLTLVRLAWKPDALDVAGFVEIRIVDPPMFSGAAFDVLLEPGDGEETLSDGFF